MLLTALSFVRSPDPNLPRPWLYFTSPLPPHGPPLLYQMSLPLKTQFRHTDFYSFSSRQIPSPPPANDFKDFQVPRVQFVMEYKELSILVLPRPGCAMLGKGLSLCCFIWKTGMKTAIYLDPAEHGIGDPGCLASNSSPATFQMCNPEQVTFFCLCCLIYKRSTSQNLLHNN